VCIQSKYSFDISKRYRGADVGRLYGSDMDRLEIAKGSTPSQIKRLWTGYHRTWRPGGSRPEPDVKK
jgi:hypothetical protein